jgi:hypothetical protein
MPDIFLRYGSYTHAANEAIVAVNKATQETEGGQPYETVCGWQINGILLPTAGNEVASLVTKRAAIEQAYSRWFQDATFFTSDGIIIYQLSNALSVRGVRVVSGPTFQGEPTAYSTGIPYTIGLQASFPAAGAGSLIHSWSETLTIVRGGPVYGMIEPLNAAPIRYVAKRSAPWRATQVGQAVGFYGRPPVPAAIWPGLIVGQPQFSDRSPRYQGGRFVDFGVSWSYEFSSAGPLAGEATRQPVV